MTRLYLTLIAVLLALAAIFFVAGANYGRKHYKVENATVYCNDDMTAFDCAFGVKP